MMVIHQNIPRVSLIQFGIMKHSLRLATTTFLCLLFTGIAFAQDDSISLRNGDRVLFVGDGLFENELDYGYLEYALTTAWPKHDITFRNIGWSGDTPKGISRDHFTNPPTAYEHLIEQIKTTDPTIAFVGYGAHMAFEAPDVSAGFIADLASLVDTLEAIDARVVLITPVPLDPQSSPSPSVREKNERLKAVSEQITTLSQTRSLGIIDLYNDMISPADDPNTAISDNGIQLNELGYFIAGLVIDGNIKTPERVTDLAIDLKKNLQSPTIKRIKKQDKSIAFELELERLPLLHPDVNPYQPREHTVTISGLPRGNYSLWSGNKKIKTASSRDWARGVTITSQHTDQGRQLLKQIYKKNRTYFYQYRPQNETYLVGFREYEQGQNARELQLLDPLIGEIENEIGRLRVPRALSMRLVAD